MKNIVFCGFGKLGRDCLNRLINEGYIVKYVFTHKSLENESVDLFCREKGIEFSYSDTRKEKEEFVKLLKPMNLNYLISVNYRYILPKEIFEIPIYSINIHGSLLPKYRGRTPHVWSIINGEKVAGITVHLITDGVDEGDIIQQKEITIESSDTGYILLEKYEKEYPTLLMEALVNLENKKELIKQDENKATYFGKRIPEMGYIDFFKNSQQIINFVRAQASPYPGAYCFTPKGQKIIVNKIVKIEDDEIVQLENIGVVREISSKFYIKCIDGVLRLDEYQLDK